jgi:hypothetical protein
MQLNIECIFPVSGSLALGVTMKVIATIGLLFFAYCLVQILAKWRSRNTGEKAIWFVIIAAGRWWCTTAFL